MSKKKISINRLDELHTTTPETNQPTEQPTRTENRGRKKAAEKRVRYTLNIKETNVTLVKGGRMEEKFKNDSEFLDHILEEYFKDKPYREQLLREME